MTTVTFVLASQIAITYYPFLITVKSFNIIILEKNYLIVILNYPKTL